jgi:hypothetical protein
MSGSDVYELVMETLKSCPLKPEYRNEERDLQPELKRLIERALDSSGLGAYDVKISLGGRGKPRVDLLGTSFWPDIEISNDNKPIIAIEVKFEKKSLAGAITSALGKSIIYKLKYKHLIGFVYHVGKTDPRLNEFDTAFHKMIEGLGVNFIIRYGN